MSMCHRGQKRVLEPLALTLQMVVGPSNWPQVLWSVHAVKIWVNSEAPTLILIILQCQLWQHHLTRKSRKNKTRDQKSSKLLITKNQCCLQVNHANCQRCPPGYFTSSISALISALGCVPSQGATESRPAEKLCNRTRTEIPLSPFTPRRSSYYSSAFFLEGRNEPPWGEIKPCDVIPNMLHQDTKQNLHRPTIKSTPLTSSNEREMLKSHIVLPCLYL